jgi:uncharacterized membrane protein
MQNVRTVLRFIAVGVFVGLVMGWLVSLVSGNFFVVLLFGSIGLLVGVVLGLVYRNDPRYQW